MALQMKSSILFVNLIYMYFILVNVQSADITSIKQTDLSNNHSLKSNGTTESLTSRNQEAISAVDIGSKQDDWNFEMVEYDLMDYLENLGARYQASNLDASMQNESSKLDSELLRAKLEPALEKANVTKASFSEMATSVASPGDQQISESSWQYGIFDRFTRPKTTSTTPDPRYTLEPGREINTKDFYNIECGLRTYDQSNVFQSPEEQPQVVDLESDAIKELNQRRQKPLNLDEEPVTRIHKFESVSEYLKNRERKPVSNSNPPSKISDWPNKDEKSVYDSYTKQIDQLSPSQQDASFESPANSPNSGDEFNLMAKRHWLQQQIDTTLKMFGFNGTAHSVFGSLDASSGPRENLMKKFGKLDKSYKYTGSESDFEKELTNREGDMRLEARVIGGNDARLGDSPWSVSLQALVARPGTNTIEYRHYCGGTIISEYYVLTAAHCLDFMVGRESRLFVVIGDLNWRMSTTSQYGRRLEIEKLIIHSGYKNTAFGHDIGLIRTKQPMKPVKVNGKYIVNSVCLPEKGVEHSGEAELVGWGLFSNRNEMADSLQIADVPILPRPLCVDLYRRRTGLIQWLIGIELITDKQVCAGTFGRGICQGDSGSALVVNERISTNQVMRKRRATRPRNQDSSRATIIGIVAFGGIRRCSYQSLPGVYMQTSKYMDWILPRIKY